MRRPGPEAVEQDTVVPPGAAGGAGDRVFQVEEAFVENWGALAEAFGMARDLGRTHGLVYIARSPVDEAAVAERLGMARGQAAECLAELVDWGVIQRLPDPRAGARFTTDSDPWKWFLQIVHERHRREFVPTLLRMRETFRAAGALEGGSAAEQTTFERIARFSRFIEDLSRLIDLFVRVGARPMAAVLKTLAKLAPRV